MEIGAALGASDLALARAGGSVWELAAAGKPAVLVPGLFATGDHQTKNARYFEQGGGAIVVPEADIVRVPDLIRSLLVLDWKTCDFESAWCDGPGFAALEDRMEAAARCVESGASAWGIG